MIAGYNKAKVIKKIYPACNERCKQNKKMEGNKNENSSSIFSRWVRGA